MGQPDRRRCYRTALCETCSQSQVRCYEDTDLSPLIAKKFKDDFCRHHGVVLVDKRSGRLQNLLPLECSNGICPDQSECKKNPADGVSYCCSLEKLATSRCFSLDVSGSSKEAVTRKITDENGNPVNISKVTLVLEKSDEKCLQGWSYFFMDDTVYISNPCPVRFEICYEPGSSTWISTNSPAVETTCQILELSSDGVAEKRVLDSGGRPVTVTSMDVIDWYSLPCRKGATFTFSESVVRVTGGCRGNFRVCYLNNTDSEDEMTTPQVPINEQECQNVTLQSAENGRAIHPFAGINSRLHIVSMELVNQLSTVQCIQWLNYYSEGSMALAKNECSGQFEVCYLENVTLTPVSLPEPAGKTCRVIALSSRRSRETQRVITDVRGENVTIRNMTLARQISQTACVEGTTFSFHGSKAVSRGGCIGTFQICYDAIDLHITAAEGELCDTEVTLSSNISQHGEHNHKLTDAHGTPLAVQTMTLLKQFSEVQCVAGHSYFFFGPTAFALDGCTGTFKVCYNISGSERERSALAVTTPGGAPQCGNVKLMSRLKLPVNKTFMDSEGRPLPIISVHRVEQISKVECVESTTFKVARYVLRVFGGCKAVFRVCVGTPDEDMTTPVEVMTTPVEDMTTPVEDMTTPVEDMTTPVEDMTTPVEDMTTPVEDMTTAATPTASTESRQQCETVKLMSRLTLPVKKTFVDSEGNPLPIISVRLVEQISTVECAEGVTFKVRRYRLRVFGGCRAVFHVCVGAPVEDMTTPSTPTDSTGEECKRLLIDSSRANKLKLVKIVDQYKRPVRITNVKVKKQISDVSCRPWKTFHYEDNIVRATGGCRALFNVCFEKESLSSPKEECVNVTLRSRLDKTKAADIRDKGKNPVWIVHVKVLTQISYVPCIKWQNYDYDGVILRASDGCSAVFKVCYSKKGR